MKKIIPFFIVALSFSCMTSVDNKAEDTISNSDSTDLTNKMTPESLLNKYVSVKLTTDISKLHDGQKEMIPYLIEAAQIMDEIFWLQAYGDKNALLNSIDGENLRKYATINYGPWDRLNGNKPFIEGVQEKLKGANFYPSDMTKEEFEKAELDDKTSLYTLLRRDEEGDLMAVPYHAEYAEKLQRASGLLLRAAELAENLSLRNYLKLRAEALLTDEYYESDMAWMDMTDNQIDIIIGPIENYEDQLFGYKAANEAYVLVKDMEWSERLAKYSSMLPELQKNLPVEDKYKKEKPGTDSQLAAFDVIFYAGDCNAGSKTIAVNLPNDEEIQLKKGTRRSQLKNAMQAKFDKILVPISTVLIDESQQKYIDFDAFFANTMFHEVAHGLGIKNTINGKGTVRESLKEHASALEEGKADILGLFMITQLHEKGEITGDLKTYYTTFIASIFRSVRFGTSSAHGKANMIRFNFFKERGVIQRSEQGVYKIDFELMVESMNELSELIITLQGDGNYDAVSTLVENKAKIGDELQSDLDRLSDQGIPVDVVFEQGVEVLGLAN